MRKEYLGGNMNHPYEQYMETALWFAIDKGIDDLSKNHDIIETTSREYIVGYLCKVITGASPKTI